ncbi:transcriptional repressor [Ferruginibacter lapsinanis]|uniref:Fur family transcriptional regulator n=1 Tax=Ferruginibacter lapsinanis TaxID=563172 RepID=UPI001E4E2382|nr:Fur family transcriptional regulator [Ferruginibacter lapsinanis]UEG50636.1 transcriptional repressor [Ferruginibacter lapsinanis]
MVLEILKKNQLSVTDGRKKILELFLNSEGALEHADIEKKTGENFDRVTVYRTLQTFVEKGIIHHIPTTDNSILYALCKDNCEAGHHHDNHVHFVCEVCNKTICLEDVTVPEVKLPKGFTPEQAEMVVKGVCADCK